MHDSFRDNPAFVVNPPTQDTEKTVVVLGAFRGGTSMVARALLELGVFMGERFGERLVYKNFEDLDFQELLHRSAIFDQKHLSTYDFPPAVIDAVIELAMQRDRNHRIWGWKYPGTAPYLLHTRLASQLRNPHFITVFRDPVAVFQHEAEIFAINPANVRSATERSFYWVIQEMRRLGDHLMACPYPHLAISFERTLTGGPQARRNLIETLARFLEPALAEPNIESALAAIAYPVADLPTGPQGDSSDESAAA
jgi:hypothetical protein